MVAHTPFLVRHRRAVTIGAGAALALLFAVHAHHWHFPYRIAGAAGEWPLLAGSVAVAIVARVAFPGVFPRRSRDAAMPAAAIAGVIAFLMLQSADPFATKRDWRYAPAGCDFAVSFPQRPSIFGGELKLPNAATASVSRAVLIDIGKGIAWSAECVPFDRTLAETERAVIRDSAEAPLRRAATALRLKIGGVARPNATTLVLTGMSDEGRTADNAPLLRKAEARAIAGAQSLLVLWAWRITRDENAGVEAAPFLESVRPANAR